MREMPKKVLALLVVAVVLVGGGLFVFAYPQGRALLPVDLASLPLIGQFFPSSPLTSGPVTLTYWGLFEPPSLMEPLIEQYQEEHPNVEIEYSQREYADLGQHKETLLTRLRQGSGPDLMRIHASWIPQFYTELVAAPSSILSFADFSTAFYPVAVESLTVEQSVYAVPLEYDGLMLFYNQAMFDEANVANPPTTWGEFRTVAIRLIKRGGNNELLQAGAAIGGGNNIDHASDILGLMLAQSNVQVPEDLDSQAAQDALVFYTNFMTVDRVWDTALPEATIAFARGEVAMIFAPSWQVFAVQAINPGLDFALAPVPQLPSGSAGGGTVYWASFWAEAVSRDSEHLEAAWDFLKFLSSAEVLQDFYANAAQNRAFGEPYPRMDLAGNLSADPMASQMVVGAMTAQTGILAARAGNNEATEAVVTAIEAVLKGGEAKAALATLKETLSRL